MWQNIQIGWVYVLDGAIANKSKLSFQRIKNLYTRAKWKHRAEHKKKIASGHIQNETVKQTKLTENKNNIRRKTSIAE